MAVMSKHLRQRIENCIATILELDRNLGEGQIRPEIIRQFERLKNFMEMISDESASGVDIAKIEAATTSLLDEIRESLARSGISYHYRGRTN